MYCCLKLRIGRCSVKKVIFLVFLFGLCSFPAFAADTQFQGFRMSPGDEALASAVVEAELAKNGLEVEDFSQIRIVYSTADYLDNPNARKVSFLAIDKDGQFRRGKAIDYAEHLQLIDRLLQTIADSVEDAFRY